VYSASLFDRAVDMDKGAAARAIRNAERDGRGRR
jgi:hypothetical protein